MLASFDANLIRISFSLNSPNMFFLSSFWLVNMLPIDIRFNSSFLNLCTCKVIKRFRRFSFMVARRYVLTLLREEKDLSLMAFVAGITNKSFTTLITSESKFFLAGLRLLNFLRTSEIFIFFSERKEILTVGYWVSSNDFLISFL